jgi:hypothetical protein
MDSSNRHVLPHHGMTEASARLSLLDRANTLRIRGPMLHTRLQVNGQASSTVLTPHQRIIIPYVFPQASTEDVLTF